MSSEGVVTWLSFMAGGVGTKESILSCKGWIIRRDFQKMSLEGIL